MKTVKVRIAVCICPDGSYGAYGWAYENGHVDDTDAEMRDMAAEAADPDCEFENARTVYFVTAELPIPEAREVPGVVEVAPGEPAS